MTDAEELLATIPHHETAHGPSRDIVDLLRDGSPPSRSTSSSRKRRAERKRAACLAVSADEPHAPRDRRELYVSINTVNTHIRNIYSKAGRADRSAAVQRARELRLISGGRSRGSVD